MGGPGTILVFVHPLPRRAFVGLELSVPTTGCGLEVAAVHPDSTATAAGLRIGDRLLAFAGHAVDTGAMIRRIVRNIRSGQLVEFVVERDGVEHRFVAPTQPMHLETIDGAQIHLDQVEAAGHRLRTIATQPLRCPAPAVLILPDKSCVSCEQPTDPTHPLQRLITAWTASGWATFRVERSGLGDSEGPACEDTDLEVEIAGFRAGLRQLFALPWVDKKCIYIFGHSLGGIEAPLVARGMDVRGIAVYGATAWPWSKAVLASARRHGRAAGARGPRFERGMLQLESLLQQILHHGREPATVLREHPELRAFARAAGITGNRLHGRSAKLFRQLEGVDLERAWKDVKTNCIPTLVLRGSRDNVVTAAETRQIADLSGGFEHELEDLDHFIRASSGTGVDVLATVFQQWQQSLDRAEIGEQATRPKMGREGFEPSSSG